MLRVVHLPRRMGCTPFQRLVKEAKVAQSRGYRDVKTLQQSGSAAGAEFALAGAHPHTGRIHGVNPAGY
ncbi:hypothetical protein ACLB1M_18070 [Escherichia coli]